jgi:hypothetical protein
MLLERVQQELLLVRWHLQEVLLNLLHLRHYYHHLMLQVLLVLLERQLAIIHLKLMTITL